MAHPKKKNRNKNPQKRKNPKNEKNRLKRKKTNLKTQTIIKIPRINFNNPIVVVKIKNSINYMKKKYKIKSIN